MKRTREFWSRHVEAWRASGLSQREYCRRHKLLKGTLGYWSSTLGRENGAGLDLVEVGRTTVEPKPATPSRPIEVVVEGRYLMRLWPGTDRGHMQEVLSVLEARR
jgi:hypothetical protein